MNGKRTRWLRQHRIQIRPTCPHTSVTRVNDDRDFWWRCSHCGAEVNWRLYVVRCSDNTLYTGITNDLDRRINEHNTSKRGAKYTKTRRPVELIYYESYKNRSAAQQAEYAFKKLKREQKEKKIQESHSFEQPTVGEREIAAVRD